MVHPRGKKGTYVADEVAGREKPQAGAQFHGGLDVVGGRFKDNRKGRGLGEGGMLKTLIEKGFDKVEGVYNYSSEENLIRR